MGRVLPLFPLGTVLFPGLVLPLHVFEERYRDLVRDLLARPEPDQVLGVLAIRQGREVGADGITALYAVGCAAQLSQVEAYDDGRFDIVTVGTRRFRLDELHEPDGNQAYLQGTVTWLPDELGDPAQVTALDPLVRRAFGDYLEALTNASGGRLETPDLPDEALVLSHVVAATMLLDLSDRQDLLEQPDGLHRLRRELRLLSRETGLLTTLAAAPAPELARTPYSPN